MEPSVFVGHAKVGVVGAGLGPDLMAQGREGGGADKVSEVGRSKVLNCLQNSTPALYNQN